MADLSQRARQVLYHAVTEYVATGEPVGSRTLAKKSGLELSPASIRNVLSDLEEAGYLAQPHTSAGRVPTDKAFRLFIDVLMNVQEVSRDEAIQIRARFATMEPGTNVARETGKLLSDLTGTAAVVVAPRLESRTLKHLRFIRTGPRELLAVLVMSDGSVHNRFLAADVTESQLVVVHNLLDDVIDGRTLGDLRELFARRLVTERVQQDDVRRRAFELGGAAVSVGHDEGGALVIEGQQKLLEKPEFSDPSGVKQIVSALDAREQLVSLLDATMTSRGNTVVVGQEAVGLGGGQLAFIGAAYMHHGHAAGSVGVIGPTRMDYPKVLPIVTATANAMGEFMERTQKDERGPESDENE